MNDGPVSVLRASTRVTSGVQVGRYARLMLGALLTTCSLNEPTPPGSCQESDLGEFSGSVTGDLSAQLSGCVSYTAVGSGTIQSTIVTLTSRVSSSPSLTVRRRGAPPDTGTYEIQTQGNSSAGDFSGSIVFQPGSRSFVFTSGTMTIDGSTNIAFAGFFTAVAVESASNDSVNVSVAFTARCSTC